jgi:hypothetical protein
LSPLEGSSAQRQPDSDQEGECEHVLEHVIEDVMAHPVAHHQLYFFQGRPPQQIVVEADSSGAEQAADVRADSRRLARLVNHVDVIDGDAVGTHRLENRFADPCLGREARVMSAASV